MQLILASNNEGKIKEFSDILGEIGIEIVSMKQMGIDVDVVEDKEIFLENAIKKASEICKICNQPVIADDSGLCVDYLGGAPGVYSARYSAPNPTPEKNRIKLLEELKGVPQEQRRARFICTLALVYPDGRLVTVEGQCEGIITDEPRGESGFGYDPLFYYSEFDKTFAELSADQKNRVSHRGRAIRNLRDELEKMM